MCMTTGPIAPPAPGAGRLPPAAVDHHLHIQGPEVTAELRRMAERLPEMFRNLSPALLETRTLEDALAALDEAGIGRGVLLSQAYTFASPFASPDLDVARLTRQENAYVVDAARRSGGRLAAFIGVNPLAEGAAAELHHWAGRDGVTGVKLHFGNSGFDPDKPDHLAKTAEFFALARAAALPLIVHVSSARPYAESDTQRFMEAVLPRAGNLAVQIAHAGGGGGLDEATLSALERYAGAPASSNLWFDLAVVLVRDPADPVSAARLQRLAALLRRLGLDRVLVGSDWPALCRPREHNALLTAQLPLAQAEWRQVLANRAPYLH